MSPVASSSSPGMVEDVIETIQSGDLDDLILMFQCTEASELDSEGESRSHELEEV